MKYDFLTKPAQKGLDFIKTYPRILYSLVLLILIPTAIFLNTFYILNLFQGNIDTITHSKAILAENIINLTAQNFSEDPQKLESFIDKTISENEEIKQFEFMFPKAGQNENFQVIASSEKDEIGSNNSDIQNVLAWSREEGIAFLGTDGNERLWKVTKLLKNENGEKIGLVSLAFSLRDSDSLINSTIDRSYLILIATVIIVLLLVINNTRFFGYALTVSKLKEVDKMKDNFISMASHELRSPLTAIRGYLEFFNDKNKKKMDSESARYLENINISVERLNALVNDLLEISRLEGNRIPFNITPTDPQPIIQKSIDEMKSQAIEKKLSLLYIPSELPRVKADPERMEQILINLIGNAIKYTPSGKVEVLTEIKGKKLLITVADTGIGISAEDMRNMFEKFYRIKNEETQSIIGTGLGLWISREIARKMGGNISVESIKGVGSHFTLHLPLA